MILSRRVEERSKGRRRKPKLRFSARYSVSEVDSLSLRVDCITEEGDATSIANDHAEPIAGLGLYIEPYRLFADDGGGGNYLSVTYPLQLLINRARCNRRQREGGY